MNIKIKIALFGSGWLLSILVACYITWQYQEGRYAKEEAAAQIAYNKQITEKIANFQKQQEALNAEANAKIKELQTLNTNLEKKWNTALKEKNAAVANYDKLIAEGWVLKDPTSKCDLSATTAKFLVEMAMDADLVVEQLLTSQEYAKNLRQIIVEGNAK